MAILHPILLKVYKSDKINFHYNAPKDSESLKVLDIRLWEVEAKRRLNGTSKSEHTDRQTHKQTHMDKLTYTNHRPRGPML